MRHLTKTNKHFLLVGLTFLATSLIFYILAWLGQPSLENTLVNVCSLAFTLGISTYVLLGLKMITDTLKTSSHSQQREQTESTFEWIFCYNSTAVLEMTK